MNKFSILCTKDQIRKALELGAPLETCDWRITDTSRYIELDNEKGWHIQIPTAEEMIGWLESEKSFSFDIRKRVVTWSYFIYYKMRHFLQDPVIDDDGFTSREEATLAAIDAALEYLEKYKTIK